jgi:dTDP-4-amino-4,6-dideoxygalactose transaminase/ribosomal protein S18 acetylase RimI-like enzyme
MSGADVDAVVSIHLAAFPGFFLTSLGARFLSVFYRAVIDDPSAVALAAVENGRVAGFAVGSLRPRDFYRRLLRRRTLSIALAVVTRPHAIARVLRRARNRTSGAQPEGAELMSLAVAPADQHRGHGRALLRAFAGRIESAGATRLWLLTDADDNEVVTRFYSSLGFDRARTFTNSEGRRLHEYAKVPPAGKFIPFALPDIDHNEIDAVQAVLESGWLTTGERVKDFERAVAEFTGARHAVALNSGTAALHLALDAIGLKAGDEVIVPAYTFAATAEVVLYFDAIPVLVDVEARTLNIDPAEIERKITDRTRAIIPVDFGGLPADLDRIRALARARNMAVIEDAAHSLTARYNGRMIGCVADITCLSFYATKTITTGEGGMFLTDSDAYAERARIMSLHGISRDAWKRYTQEGSWFYEVVDAGYKYNMTDIAAALGLAQLQKALPMRERRQAIASRYHAAFGGDDRVEVPHSDSDDDHAWHLYPLRLNLEKLSIDRAGFIGALRGRGIGASVHFIPLHLHPFYRDRFGFQPDDFPVSHREYLREISLPIYSKMTDAHVDRVIAAVLEILEDSAL